MDLQSDASLETMALSAPSSGAATAGPLLTLPPLPLPRTPVVLRGFTKQIAQGVVEEKFLCEHCKLILRHPMQSRCGHRFCRSCRDELISQNQPIRCQACLTEGATEEESLLELESMFDDKAAIREMKKIPVKCVNQGCQWKGTFLDYSTTHEFGCDKKLVECSLCGVPVSQARITHHETKQCPKRNISCQHCKEPMVSEQLEKHLQAHCPNLPIKCDKCSKQITRCELKTHKDEECPFRIVECPVPDCNTKLPFDQFPNHLMKTQQSTQKHLLFLFDKIEQLEKTISQMEAEAAGAVGGASGGAAHGAALGQFGSSATGGDLVTGAEASAVATDADRQKLKLHEDLMAVLHGEILRCIKQVESLDARFMREDRYFKDAYRKIENLERSIAGMEDKLQDVIRKQNETDLRRQLSATGALSDPKEHGILSESPDGTVTWRIDKFTQVRRAACNGLQAYISSPAFFAGPFGYKMKIRFYADGDGTAKGKAFSLFIQLQRGPYDDLLLWPFTGKIYFMILDLKDFKEHKLVSFSALPDQPAFERPQGENTSSGCLEFVNLKEFSDNLDKYLVNDTIFIKAYVSLPDAVQSRLQSFDLKKLISARR
ncbi:unnamed protein product [Candidula unifasciata]|uniref:TNF receptor-associated factor n=1 Tax=Candidula unifasciata TaxID=100452 RepID=A0A8S4A6K3_9EUPU|nr:unnamed protein product [Candidula unifasciata]